MSVVSTVHSGYARQSERRIEEDGTIDLDEDDWRRR
jgi:hypothetical protein